MLDNWSSFPGEWEARYTRDAMLVRVLAKALCASQVGVLSKGMDVSSWFLANRLLSTYPTSCYKEIKVSKGTFF